MTPKPNKARKAATAADICGAVDTYHRGAAPDARALLRRIVGGSKPPADPAELAKAARRAAGMHAPALSTVCATARRTGADGEARRLSARRVVSGLSARIIARGGGVTVRGRLTPADWAATPAAHELAGMVPPPVDPLPEGVDVATRRAARAARAAHTDGLGRAALRLAEMPKAAWAAIDKGRKAAKQAAKARMLKAKPVPAPVAPAPAPAPAPTAPAPTAPAPAPDTAALMKALLAALTPTAPAPAPARKRKGAAHA